MTDAAEPPSSRPRAIIMAPAPAATTMAIPTTTVSVFPHPCEVMATL